MISNFQSLLMARLLLIVVRRSGFFPGLPSELLFVGETLYPLWIVLSRKKWKPKGQKRGFGLRRLVEVWA